MLEKHLEDLINEGKLYLRPKDKGDFREHLLNNQQYQCAICDKELQDMKNSNRHLDHCHKSKLIRGVLCANCNMVLGKIERAGYGPDWLLKLHSYLLNPSTNIIYPEKITSKRKTMKDKMRNLLKEFAWGKPDS